MNLESYDLDSLLRLVRRLIEENNNLKRQLSEADIPFESEDFFNDVSEDDDYDEDQAGRIYEKQINEQLANHFYAMFPLTRPWATQLQLLLRRTRPNPFKLLHY